ncbi:MAG: EF-hand domain-containing protein [Patiriisocius sp.]|uniref:EF-hand domain-containing protein n=1 Tax=Patiriisocius sp. TaxID=2822396 RepID=UPI003EF31936
MSTKDDILNKIHLLIATNFSSPKDAYNFFDEDGNGKLNKNEIVKLLKEAEISGFIRGMVASKLIEGYDKEGDELISWSEFKAAVDEINEKK